MIKFDDLRHKLGELFENKYSHMFIFGLIILSTVSIGYEVSLNNTSGGNAVISMINNIIVIFFAIEMAARIIAHGREFFRDPWHVFDFIVVAVSLISFGGFFQIFRAFRLFWFLRTFTIIPQFQHLISAIGHAIPHMLSAAAMLFMAVYIFGLIGSIEFGPDHSDKFGTVSVAMSTIFHSVLMEHTWSELLSDLEKSHTLAWAYVFPMIIILNFLLLHLVLGIIINALERQHERDNKKVIQNYVENVMNNGGIEVHKDPTAPVLADTKLIIHAIQSLESKIEDLSTKK